MFALASIGLLAFATAPTPSLAEPQEPPEEKSGGLARTEEDLGALGRLANTPDPIPLKKAITAYNSGLEYSNKASRLEEQAATADGQKAGKKASKARQSYEKAIGQFRTAIELVPDFYQALGGLGYALLRTGRYEEALEAYDRALAIGPPYPEALEERGEAYLGLDRIEEAKEVYMQPIRIDSERAAELMTAMTLWLDRRRRDAGGLPEEAIESFAVWIEKRTSPLADAETSTGSPKN